MNRATHPGFCRAGCGGAAGLWKRSADTNGDGVRDVLDFLEFVALFDAADAMADFDEDAELTLYDFLAFANAFNE